MVAGRDRTKLVDGCAKQLAAVTDALRKATDAAEVPVAALLCFVDADLPLWGDQVLRGSAWWALAARATCCAGRGRSPRRVARSFTGTSRPRCPRPDPASDLSGFTCRTENVADARYGRVPA